MNADVVRRRAGSWRESVSFRGARNRTSSLRNSCSSQAQLGVFERREKMSRNRNVKYL